MNDLSKYKNRRVLVAMSGGLDSTMSAILLKEAGAICVGVTMKTWDYANSGGTNKTTGCCSLDDINDARELCVSYGIPHNIYDIRTDFTESVINNFVDEYMNGRTPNPCIMCNTHIKWGALLSVADKLKCEYIATGHYANIRYDDLTSRYILSSGTDVTKDQSYVLWGLPQEVLARTIFPMGTYEKSDIRKLASDRNHLAIANKKESYEICFVPDNNYRAFLSRRRDIKPGNFIDSTGKIIGEHDGYPYFTIGQRKGLGNAGSSEIQYVININALTGEVTLGNENELLRKSILVKNINTIKYPLGLLNGMSVLANIRYRGPKTTARITVLDKETVRLDFNHQIKAISPGQSTVWYDINNIDDVIGGGHILNIIE